MEKRAKSNVRSCCANIPWRSAHRNVRSGSAKKLVNEPPATTELDLCSAAIMMISFNFIFTALELSVLKPWLVRPPNESDRTVNVKRVLTKCDSTDPDARLFPCFFFGHGGMLRVRGSPADLPSAPFAPADFAD